MPKRKTQKEFIEEVNKITNNEYLVIGKYINNKTKIKFKHLKCNCEFETIPKDFINGKSRCKQCGYNKLKTMNLKSSEKFEEEFNEKSKGEYILLDKYTSSQTKIKVKHKKCGYEFQVTPNNFLSKSSGCPKCFGNIRKSTNEFRKEVEIIGEGEYELVGEYVRKSEKTIFLHKVCGKTFEMSPDKFTQGHRCTNCVESKGEARVRKVLTDLKLDFATQYRFNDCRGKKYPLPFDFAVFKNGNLIFLIEYDGEQHFKLINFKGVSDEKALISHQLTKNNDLIKNEYCKNKNIKLIRIPYYEYNNIFNILSNMAIPSQASEETPRRCND